MSRPKQAFRLTSLLRLREATRDECRSALAEACRIDDLLRQRLDRIAEGLGQLGDVCRGALGPGLVDVDRAVEAQRYASVLGQQQAKLRQHREVVGEEIQRRRQALVDADREVRVLDKLRQRQADQSYRQAERQDAKRLDEVAQQNASVRPAGSR